MTLTTSPSFSLSDFSERLAREWASFTGPVIPPVMLLTMDTLTLEKAGGFARTVHEYRATLTAYQGAANPENTRRVFW